FVNDTGHLPDPAALAEARARTGMHLVTLDETDFTVRYERPGVLLDLGGIGKGYAVDEAMAVLAEAGVERAFLHGGTSTIAALGQPGEAAPWTVALLPEGGDGAGAAVQERHHHRRPRAARRSSALDRRPATPRRRRQRGGVGRARGHPAQRRVAL